MQSNPRRKVNPRIPLKMNKEQASELITNTFNSGFELSKYRNFIINLLDGIDTESPKAKFDCSESYIKDSFRPYISAYGRIGKYIDKQGNKIEPLWVKLKKCDSVSRARTMQRNFIAWYLNGGRGGKLRDNALVAFYSEDNPSDWRFSFVKLETYFKDFKVGVDFTPPKRYSFLVGENEPNHTAKARLVGLLTKDYPEVKEIEDAFNIEKVSNEFFKHYQELFLSLLDNLIELRKKDSFLDLAIIDINNADFCKKLMGQLVFLYFIQKKGWLGVKKNDAWGNGDKAFLRHTFERAIREGKNFFNDYLEPLFYNALANGERDDNWFELLECRIPFLNGGLFEPIYDWVNTDIVFDNSIFSNDEQSAEGDCGTGILDVFDRYNFTVKEDEPLEKEVAVDPEMLGKVFENLLEINDRKSKGAFYTPREIVHYMCQESLINYLCTKLNAVDSDSDKFEIPEKQKTLDIDEQQPLRSSITKSDIAEFIKNSDKILQAGMGIKGQGQVILQKSVATLKPYAKDLDSALESIKICDPAIGSGAFPVGMLNEIVKARRALVEGGFLREAQKRTIYEYKRQAIQNSIYGVDIESGAIDIAKLRLWLSLVVDEDDFQNIKPLPNLSYKIVCGNSLLRVEQDLFNRSLFETLEALKQEYFDETRKGRKTELSKKIDNAILELKKNDKDSFDYNIFFSEVFHANGGFDVIIGNPPYIQLQKLKGDPIQKVYKDLNFEVYDSMGDIYCIFYEKGLSILKEGGVLSFITSNKWMRAGYGEKLREFFVKNNPRILIDLGPNVFETATVDTNILLIEKKPYTNSTYSCSMKEKGTGNMSDFIRQNSTPMSFDKNSWCILSPIEQSIKRKIEAVGVPLKDWNISINYGIKTGCNEAFIIDGATKDALIAQDPKSAEIIRPILRGRDIKRYSYEFADKWLIYVPWHFPLHKDTSITGASKEAEHEFEKQYPAIYNRLLSYKPILEKRNKAETGIRYEWYALQRCAATYMDDFSKQKIAWASVGETFYSKIDRNQFLLDTNYFFATQEPYYLLGILNSKLITFWINSEDTPIGSGGAYRHYKYNLEKLAIPILERKDKLYIEHLVETILESKSTALQKDIDTFVYKIFNLSEEEINFVEQSIE